MAVRRRSTGAAQSVQEPATTIVRREADPASEFLRLGGAKATLVTILPSTLVGPLPPFQRSPDRAPSGHGICACVDRTPSGNLRTRYDEGVTGQCVGWVAQSVEQRTENPCVG